MKMIPSPWQITAGRGLLQWSLTELAEKAGVSRTTLTRVEASYNPINNVSREKVQRVLEDNGVVFIPEGDGMGDGVRLLRPRRDIM